MAGIGAATGQAAQALKSVERYLDTRYGIVLLHPAYTRYHLELGEITIFDEPKAFPLGFQMARSFIGERLALVGDAAHTIHPIAGQGINMGLRDVAALITPGMEGHEVLLGMSALKQLEFTQKGGTLVLRQSTR